MSREWKSEDVKALRKRLGKTQKEFGELLGVHVVTIIRWESEKFGPSKMASAQLDRLNTES